MKGEDAALAAERVQHEVWLMIGQAFARQGDAEATALGLTQSDLARRLGVPRGQVWLWLRDRERMTLKAAARLAHAMGYDLHVQLVRRTRVA